MRAARGIGVALRARVLAAVVVLACVPLASVADLGPQLQRAVDWLVAQIQSVAVSGEAASIANPVQVRGETVQTLRLLSRMPAPLADAVYSHDAGAAQIDTETLARRVLAGAPNARDVESLLAGLRERRNADGGFGGGPGYRSSVLDTAWTVLAFAQAGQAAAAEASAARQYLAAQLDADGAVKPALGGVRENTSTRLYRSAMVSLALQTHSDSAASVQRMVQFLSAQQGTDGGWAGDAVITAWVLQALSAVSSDNGLKDAASAFLLARQSGDGSWSGDPYVTAVALRALSSRRSTAPSGASSIAGTVIDAQSGLPLDGASVAVTRGADAPIAGISDASGRFNVQELAAAAYTLTVSRAGYQTLSSTASLAAAQTLDLGQVRLAPLTSSGLVRGVVGTLEGVAIAGATVQLVALGGTQSAVTDSLGRYEFSAVPVGTVLLTASFSGFQNASGSASLLAGQTLVFSPSLARIGQTADPGGQFFGQTVKASDGSPIAGATVALTNASTGTVTTLATSSDGRFAQTLMPASYTVRYTAIGFNPAQQSFVLTAGTHMNAGVVALGLLKTTSEVRGRVLDTAGNAIAGATVTVVGANPPISTRSAADGAYWVANAGTTSVSLRASATGYNAQSVVLQSSFPTEMQHDFALTPQSGGTLRIDAFAVTPGTLGGRSLLAGSATLTNTGTQNVATGGGFVVLDAQNQIVAEGGLLAPTGQPLAELTLAPAASMAVTVQWNTAQFAPGGYQLVLRLVEPGSRTRENPQGNLLVERAGAFSITASPSIHGSLTIDPPVLKATGGGSTTFTATVQNVGNTELAAGDYRLEVRNTAAGTLALSRTVGGPPLAVSALGSMDFGTWTPAAAGNYSVSVVAVADPARGALVGNLYVGEASTGRFTLDKSLVPTGTQTVRATVNVTGEDVAGAITDPLAAPIKTAIQKSVSYGDSRAGIWPLPDTQRCLGCHVQTQALVGGELTRRFTDFNVLNRNHLFNALSTFRQPNGGLYISHPEFARTQTMLGLWALNAWRDRDAYAASLTAVADYVLSGQAAAGNWNADYPAGWWAASSTNTAFNLKSLAEVADTLKRVPSPQTYIRQTVRAGNGVNGAYSLLKDGAARALVANFNSGTLMAVNLDGTAQTLATGLLNPYGLLRMPDGSFLVGTRSGILRYTPDGSAATTFGPLPSPGIYGNLALMPDGRVLMASAGQNVLYVFPATGGAPSVYFSGGPLNGPTGMAYDATGNLIVVNYYGQSIVRIKPDRTAEVIVRWVNGSPRTIVPQGAGWLLGTTSGVYRYNAEWQGERLAFGQSDAVDVLDDGAVVTGDGASTVSRLAPSSIDGAAKIAAYTTAIGKANTWLLADGNTDGNNTMQVAHRLIGLGAAKAFYAGTPTADTVQNKMSQLATTLRSRQRTDGGWGLASGYGSDSMVTAMVGYALDYLNPSADDPVVRKAILFLLGRQQADGSWTSENGILGTRLAATTWVEIWLPIALDRIGGLDTQLTLRFPSSIAFSNSTIAPSSVAANADGSATHKWTLNSVTSAGRSLQFDLTLAGLQANETRPAAQDAFLTFNNSFTNQALDAAIGIPAVRASAFLDLTVRTDKPSYGADFPVIVTAPVVNGGAGASAASVRLSVLAPDNSVVSELGTFSAGTLQPGATQSVGALWNTGTSVASAGYQARAVLFDGAGQALSTALTPFAIVNATGPSVVARIVADRAGYRPTDTVQLTDTLRNLTVSGILENLVAHTSVRDAGGAVVWQTGQPVAQLVGGSFKELLYSVPLTAAVAGAYSANLELRDSFGVTLAAAATAFTVSDSADSGAGLRGTLVAVPAEVYAGDTVALNWTLTNAGNAAFTALPTEVRIVDPVSGLLVGTLPSTAELAIGQTVQRAQSWATADSDVGKTWVAALTAQLSNGTRVTLAQDSFRVVEPPIELDLGVHGHRQSRVLALVSCPPGDDTALPDDPNCLSVRVVGLDTALTTLGVPHEIVTMRSDFERALRSGRYNTYWISGGSHKLSDTLVKEVRAAVQRGDGLVLDGVHDARNQILHPAAGVKHMGKLAGVDQTIEMLASSVFAPGNVGTLGRPEVFAIDSAEVHARFALSSGNQQPAPALLTNLYGVGRSALFAFDLLQRLASVPDDAAQLDLVRKALGYLATSDELTQQHGVTASGFEVFNSGAQPADVWVQTTLPAGVRFVGASAEASGAQPDAQGHVHWRFTLAAGERRTVVLQVRVDVPGPVDAPVSVQAARVGSSSYRIYATGALTLRTRTLAETAQDAVAAIDALLPTATSEANAKSRASRAAQQAQTWVAQGRHEQALAMWIDAADELLRIDTVDAQVARTAVARALEGTELTLARELGQP